MEGTPGAGPAAWVAGGDACEPAVGRLIVASSGTVALLDASASDRVLFDGIAVGAGTFTDVAGRRIRITREHLALIAQRLAGVFIRDLHREEIGATVGVVDAGRVDGAEVHFTGDVRVRPFTDVVRAFWDRIRLSLGFRYDPARLAPNGDGTYDLPSDFVVDHLAVVARGQFPNARLTRLLNEWRGEGDSPQNPEPEGRDPVPDPDPQTQELDRLRAQRDEAAKTADKAKADFEDARSQLAKARADLEAANRTAAAARLELQQAKSRVAADVMKLELAAGKDFDLDERRTALAAMELAALDRLRGELRAAADEAAEAANTPAAPASRPGGAAQAQAAGGLDLEKLSLTDTLRLAFREGVM